MQPVLASFSSAASSTDSSWTSSLESFFTEGAKILDKASGHLFLYLLAWLLVLGGLYFTVRTGFVQLRLFPYMVRAITSSVAARRAGSPPSRPSRSAWPPGSVPGILSA